MLKEVFARRKDLEELQKKILAIFDNKKEGPVEDDNLFRVIQDLQYSIADVLLIVVELFNTDFFSNDISYGNFISLLEFVAQYLSDELKNLTTTEILAGRIPVNDDEFLNECKKKLTCRERISEHLKQITELFKNIKDEILQDTGEALNPDFDSIFKKVYHYFKHRTINDKDLTVAEYFEHVRKLLEEVKCCLQYKDLIDEKHPRKVIKLTVYSKELEGRFVIIVTSIKPFRICTVYFKKRRERNTPDGQVTIEDDK